MMLPERMGSLDWKTIFGAIPAQATALGLATALIPIAGSMPAVVNRGDHYAIQFDATQRARLVEWLVMQLNRQPGPVRVEAGEIALRVVARKYWPWALGILGVGFIAGKWVK